MAPPRHTSAEWRRAAGTVAPASWDTDILDRVHVAVVAVDGRGRIARFNRAATRLFGFASDEVLGEPLDRLVPDEIRERHAGWIRRFADHGETSRPMGTSGLISGRHRDGRPFWALASISRTGVGPEALLTIVLTDVTDQQFAAEEGALLRDAMARSTALTCLTTLEGTVTHASRSLLTHLGVDRDDDGADRDFGVLVGDPTTATQLLTRARATGHATAEMQVDGPHGRLELHAVATLVETDNAAASITVNLHDMTQMRRVERELQRSVDNFVKAEALAHVGSWTWTIATEAITWTDEVFRIFGYEPQAIVPSYPAFLKHVHPEDRPAVEHAVSAAVADDVPYDLVHRVIRPDGGIRHVREVGDVEHDEHGAPVRMLGTVHDITDHVHQHAALEASERFSRSVFDSLTSLGVILDGGGTIVRTNRAWRRFAEEHRSGADFGLDERYLNVVDGLLTGQDRDGPTVHEGLHDVLTGDLASFRADHEVVVAGQTRWFEVRLEALDTPSGGVVALHTEITARKVAEAELAHRAWHDPLTELPNRDLVLRRTTAALQALAERPGHVAMLFMDLDRFKVINDRFGHATGDRAIKVIAQRLRTCVRSGDTLARFGGDEFVILLPHVTDPEEARFLSERVIEVFEEPLSVGGHEFKLGMSIGVATSDDPNAQAASMLRDADVAMYRAKEAGRARLVVHDAEARDSELRHIDLEQSLHGAADRGELQLHFQGLYDLDTGALRGSEALLRWEHAQHGPIEPGEFIPIAERSALILQLGGWALAEASLRAAEWRQDGLLDPDGQVSVNVSPRQLADTGFPSSVLTTLAMTGLPAANLCIEITESVLMSDIDGALGVLGHLKDRGVRIAIDDFGTGHASLGYLTRLPVDELKIDRTFVATLGDDGRNDAIVTSILALADALNLDVIAEGIETWEQLRWLRERGCHMGQGYLLGRPAPSAAEPAVSVGHADGDRSRH